MTSVSFSSDILVDYDLISKSLVMKPPWGIDSNERVDGWINRKGN